MIASPHFIFSMIAAITTTEIKRRSIKAITEIIHLLLRSFSRRACTSVPCAKYNEQGVPNARVQDARPAWSVRVEWPTWSPRAPVRVGARSTTSPVDVPRFACVPRACPCPRGDPSPFRARPARSSSVSTILVTSTIPVTSAIRDSCLVTKDEFDLKIVFILSWFGERERERKFPLIGGCKNRAVT